MIVKRYLFGRVISPSKSLEIIVECGKQTLRFEVVKLVIMKEIYMVLSDKLLSGYAGDFIIADDSQVVLCDPHEDQLVASRDSHSSANEKVQHCLRRKFPRLAVECVCDKVSMLSIMGFFKGKYDREASGSALLFGEPGTGKSTAVQGLAHYFSMHLSTLRACDLFAHSSNTDVSGGVGGGGEYADLKFVSWCNRAIALQAPCLLCLDDMESLLPANASALEVDKMTAAVMKVGSLVCYAFVYIPILIGVCVCVFGCLVVWLFVAGPRASSVLPGEQRTGATTAGYWGANAATRATQIHSTFYMGGWDLRSQ